MKKSCLRCTHYFQCKAPQKSIIFHCERFKVNRESVNQEAALLEDSLGLPFGVSKGDLATIEGTSLTSLMGLSKADLPDIYETNFGGFDAFKTIESIIGDKRIVSPDIKIPEGDFAEAPNFLTWCISPKFLGQKPYLKQAMIGTLLFGEYCPDCSDMDYIDSDHKVNDSLEKFQRKVCLLHHGKCPSCKKTRLHFYKKKKLAPYWELAVNAGQRSGKSALFGMLISYLTHRMIKLERPNEVFGLLKATVLQGTFVALTFAQAKDTLWEPFYGNLVDSAWFQEYHAMLDMVGSRTGEELYKLKDTFVQYKHRRLLCYPAGPDKRILRGRTRYAAGIDELGWFDNSIEAAKNVKMNANEVYVALENSLATVREAARNVVKKGFYNVPFGFFVNISSPSSVRDKICELVRKAQHSRVILGIHAPTWEMNPTLPRSSSYIKEKFKNDPVGAMRDFGAQPPLTNSAFIPNKDKVEKCLGKNHNSLKISYKTKKSADGKSAEIYGELIDIKESGKASVLALDAGYTNNSFAFAVGHLFNDMPIISCVGEVIPAPGTPINYSLMYKALLKEVIAMRNIVICAADRWNSLKLLSDMEEDFGVHKVQYSLKYVDMQLFKSHVEDRQVQLPRPKSDLATILNYDHSEYPQCFKHKPADHLALQLLTIQDTGSQVIKGDQLTDDIARAVMLCFRMLVEEEHRELLTKPDKAVQTFMDIKQMAVGRGYSGGSSSNMSGNGGGGGTVSSVGLSRQRQG